jgi:hypothetical protein
MTKASLVRPALPHSRYGHWWCLVSLSATHSLLLQSRPFNLFPPPLSLLLVDSCSAHSPPFGASLPSHNIIFLSHAPTGLALPLFAAVTLLPHPLLYPLLSSLGVRPFACQVLAPQLTITLLPLHNTSLWPILALISRLGTSISSYY